MSTRQISVGQFWGGNLHWEQQVIFANISAQTSAIQVIIIHSKDLFLKFRWVKICWDVAVSFSK